MRRRLAIMVGVVLLAAGAAAAAVLLSSSTTAGVEPLPIPELQPGEAFVAITEVSSTVHRFGDPVDARLRVAIDRQLADPERFEADARFTPYDSVRPVSVQRRDVGEVTVLTFEYLLQCLASACLSAAGATDVDVPETMVTVLRTDTLLQIESRVPWPTMTVVARAAGEGVVPIPAEATIDELPEPSYRIEPELLRWLATSLAAAMLVGLGLWAAVTLLRRRRTATTASTPTEDADPLALALERLARADGEPTPALRAALESLAHSLEAVDGTTLVAEARRLAWSRAAPSHSEIDELTHAVREKLGARA